MKTDARVRYTLHIIQEVFLNLLKEKPLNKITVKEICDNAEINRGTFYNHYRDVYDLMEQLENSALKRFEELLATMQEEGSYPVLITLLTSLQKYQGMIEQLSNNTSNPIFMKRLTNTCTKYALTHLSHVDSNFSNNSNKQYTYSYLASGTSSIITRWLQTGAHESPQHIAKIIDHLNQTCLSLSSSCTF